jgi:Mg2+-importing ATPase
MPTRLPERSVEAFWRLSPGDALAALASSPRGLDSQEAAARLERLGPNTLARRRHAGALSLLVRQFASPIILILVFASVLALFLGDLVDAAIILAIVLLSGLLGFWRERGAAGAVQALLTLVEAQAEVRRDGRVLSVPLAEIVPGDVVLLNAGNLAPGDGLILEARDLLVDEAALTGEAYPVEKEPGVLPAETPLARRTNALFAGTHVVSGTAEALVVHTGESTELGHISKQLEQKPLQTGFERGLTRFGYMLIRSTAVLLVLIFAANLALSRPFVDSLLFSLALAVGLTPQLLPAIVSISLSEGARRMRVSG